MTGAERAEREASRSARALARGSKSSFYPAFLLMPRVEREAILALYAWCRRSDDIVDGEGTVAERREALDGWRLELEAVFAGRPSEIRDPAALALLPVLRRYPIPHGLFVELLAGVEMDLDVATYRTPSDLEKYAYRVASVVGLMSIEIFGYSDARARPYAVSLGLALQLVNILRDVASDLTSGRVYLPLEDLERHGVSLEDLRARRDSPSLRAAAGETGRRARAHFAEARALFPRSDRRTLFPAEVMGGVYRRLLDGIEASGFDVLGERPRLPARTKAWIALREWGASRLAPRRPDRAPREPRERREGS